MELTFWNLTSFIVKIAVSLAAFMAVFMAVMMVVFAIVAAVIVALVLVVIYLPDWIRHKIKGYEKELPFDTVTLWLLGGIGDSYCIYDKKAAKRSEKQEPRGFVLRYEAKYELTKNSDEVFPAMQANRYKHDEFEKFVVKNIAGKDPCLFDTYANYHNKPWYCGKKASDTFNLTNEEELAEWLASQQQIVNSENIPIAVRGIDEETVEILWKLGKEGDEDCHELIVPNASEQELRECKIDDLLKYHEIENCKFKINNCGRSDTYFEFSEVPGYTKEELIGKARELAESMGYKFKVKEIGKE